MPCVSRHRRQRQCRRGTALVETAVVLPVFLVLLYGILEFCHVQMIGNLLQSGCRNAARLGSTEGSTSATVEARVLQTLGAAVDPTEVTVFVKDASVYDTGGSTPTNGAAVESLPDIEVGEAEERQMFVVRARVAYNDVALIPFGFFTGVVLDAQAFMRHE